MSGEGRLQRRNAVGRGVSVQHGCSQRLTVRHESGPSSPDQWVRLPEERWQVRARQAYLCPCYDPHAPADAVLVDTGQLLNHVVWPVAGIAEELASSFGARLANYPHVSKTIVLFDRYDQEAPSARDHEQTRRAIAKAVRLTPNTLLPCREDILHNATNKSMFKASYAVALFQYNIQL